MAGRRTASGGVARRPGTGAWSAPAPLAGLGSACSSGSGDGAGPLRQEGALLPANAAPVASAGESGSVTTGTTVGPGGSTSTGPARDSLTCRWRLVERPADGATPLSDPTSPSPAFVADQDGTYVVELVVDDGHLASDPVRVVIEAIPDLPSDPASRCSRRHLLRWGRRLPTPGVRSDPGWCPPRCSRKQLHGSGAVVGHVMSGSENESELSGIGFFVNNQFLSEEEQGY